MHLEFSMNLGDTDWGRRPIGDFALPEDEVHVWRIGLDLAAAHLAKLRRILPSDERERADRFRFEADQQRSVIGRGCLRLLLGEILELPADSLQFECDEFGKPRLMAMRGRPLQFNVSHSGELILIAITMGRAVGIDIERIRTDLDLDGVAARFFSANECKILASLSGPGKYEAFFTCWTRKEAYLKARGVGLSVPLDQFDVSFLPDEEPRLLATRHDPAEKRRWKLRRLVPSADYVAALAVQGSDWKLKCWDWSPLALAEGLTH
jgi:4'-phosphopantetheinyl transferase